MGLLILKTKCLNVTGYLCIIIYLFLLLSTQPVVADDNVSDEFLTGYLSSIIERDLLWGKNSYTLKIVNGVATITLFKDDPVRMEAIDKQLRTIDGLQRITVMINPDHTHKPGVLGRFTGITDKGESFPIGDLFRPLIADPKQPQFFAGFNSFKSLGVRYTMASVGFGETFGMYRFFGTREGDGLQINVEGALFARFNMDAPSYDLINADYTIGFPVTYRYGSNSVRFRIYHQSSHLGDEFLKSINPLERVNLSYEAIDLIYSLEYQGWRVYGGGEYLIHKEPGDLKSMSAQWGIEYRCSRPFVWNGRPIIGLDMKSFDEHDWDIDTSVKAGLEFGHPNPGQRRLRLMAIWYKGFDPRGQFYINKVDYYGMELSLGF